MTSLATKKCVPCEGGVPKLDPEAAARLVNAMAEVAEAEAHHPDFTVHYNRVDVSIWTHAIGGLSENDFIVAAKIDGLAEAR